VFVLLSYFVEPNRLHTFCNCRQYKNEHDPETILWLHIINHSNSNKSNNNKKGRRLIRVYLRLRPVRARGHTHTHNVMGNTGNVICECCQTYSDDHQVEGKKIIYRLCERSIYYWPFKIIICHVEPAGFWNWVCCVKKDGVGWRNR
jgi:hypothetical protein